MWKWAAKRGLNKQRCDLHIVLIVIRQKHGLKGRSGFGTDAGNPSTVSTTSSPSSSRQTFSRLNFSLNYIRSVLDKMAGKARKNFSSNILTLIRAKFHCLVMMTAMEVIIRNFVICSFCAKSFFQTRSSHPRRKRMNLFVVSVH